MIATLSRSRSRWMRSPRLVNAVIRSQLLLHHVARRVDCRSARPTGPLYPLAGKGSTLSPTSVGGSRGPSSLRRGGQVCATAAGDELALRIEYLRLGGRELTPHPHDPAADGEIAGHGHGMIIDLQISGGPAA